MRILILFLFINLSIYSSAQYVSTSDENWSLENFDIGKIDNIAQRIINEICKRNSGTYTSVAIANFSEVKMNTGQTPEYNNKCEEILSYYGYDIKKIIETPAAINNLQYDLSNKTGCDQKYVDVIDESKLPEALRLLEMFRPGGKYNGLGDPDKLAQLGKMAGIKYIIIPSIEYEYQTENVDAFSDYPLDFSRKITIRIQIFSVEVGNLFYVTDSYSKYWRTSNKLELANVQQKIFSSYTLGSITGQAGYITSFTTGFDLKSSEKIYKQYFFGVVSIGKNKYLLDDSYFFKTSFDASVNNDTGNPFEDNDKGFNTSYIRSQLNNITCNNEATNEEECRKNIQAIINNAIKNIHLIFSNHISFAQGDYFNKIIKTTAYLYGPITSNPTLYFQDCTIEFFIFEIIKNVQNQEVIVKKIIGNSIPVEINNIKFHN